MQFTLETQGSSSFLTYCMAETDVIDSMSMGMISNNRIEGIIPFHYLQMDSDRYLKYNISSKISLAEYFNGVVNKHRLLTVMRSIAAAVLNAEDYMLDTNGFVWDKEYIFVDASTAKASLICVPIEREGKNGKVNLEQLFRQLLLSVQFDQSENCDYVARLLGFFNTNTHFSLSDFHNMLMTISSGSMCPVQEVSGKAYFEKAPVLEPAPVLQRQPAFEPKPVSEGQPVFAKPSVEKKETSADKAIPGKGFGINIPEKLKENKPSAAAEEKKEKKKFSLFGSKKKEKEEKREEGTGNKTEDRHVASFNGMRIPVPASIPAPIPVSTSAPMPVPTPAPMQTPVSGREISSYNRTEPADSEATEIADSDMTQVDCAWLELIHSIYAGAAERIDLDMGKQSLLLGRASSDTFQPDVAFPSEFKKIGRQHARIDKRNGEYYITDLGSVNHTLLDGVILTPNQPYLLRDGAELALTASKAVQYRVHI